MAPAFWRQSVSFEIWLIVIALSFGLDIKGSHGFTTSGIFKLAEALIMHQLTLIKTVLV